MQNQIKTCDYRTHYLFNLLNKYIDAKYKKRKTEENKYLKTASTLTLGTAALLVWESLQIIPTTVNITVKLIDVCEICHTF